MTNIPTRRFGSMGVEVPVLGQGTWNMPRDGVNALRLGLELGMTHIDTAEMYGDGEAERLVADAIHGRRDQVFLVSKVLPSHASYKGVLTACDATLKRLRTSYLDVYLLHWPSATTAIGETMRAMEDLVDAGKIRALGVSNFDLDELREAQSVLRRHRIVCNQVLYHSQSRGIEYSLLPYCESQQIAIVGYTPFGRRFPEKALGEIARRLGKTPRQVALNFLTRRPSLFAIPKAGNPEHTRENAGAAGWKLSPQDLDEIDRLFPPPARKEPLDTA